MPRRQSPHVILGRSLPNSASRCPTHAGSASPDGYMPPVMSAPTPASLHRGRGPRGRCRTLGSLQGPSCCRPWRQSGSAALGTTREHRFGEFFCGVQLRGDKLWRSAYGNNNAEVAKMLAVAMPSEVLDPSARSASPMRGAPACHDRRHALVGSQIAKQAVRTQAFSTEQTAVPKN
jgi:hypothetical protein